MKSSENVYEENPQEMSLPFPIWKQKNMISCLTDTQCVVSLHSRDVGQQVNDTTQ